MPNIDERLDRLTARHEALTESVEILTRDVQQVAILLNSVGDDISRLVHVAEIHEKRISDLEGEKS